MNRDDKVLAVYPPHLEGASMSASEKRHRRVAPVSKDGAAPWFETPRTRSANLGRPKIAAPHHETGTDHVCMQLSETALEQRSCAHVWKEEESLAADHSILLRRISIVLMMFSSNG